MSADEHAWYEDVVMPALLGAARRAYGSAMRQGLHEAGFEDMPRRGMLVVGGIARNGPLVRDDFVRGHPERAARRQRLVETLAERGYIEGAAGEPLRLTDRGRSAAAASAAAVDRVDAAVARRFSAAEVATVRRVLGTMADLVD